MQIVYRAKQQYIIIEIFKLAFMTRNLLNHHLLVFKYSARIMTESLSGKVVDLSSNYYQLFIKDFFFILFSKLYKENL